MNNKIKLKNFEKYYLQNSLQYANYLSKFHITMAPYILYEKHNMYIYNLVKTSKLLKLAGDILQKNIRENKQVLFIGIGKLASLIVEKEAKKSNSFYINFRWLSGLITNWYNIKKQINFLNKLEKINIDTKKVTKIEYIKQFKKIKKLNHIFFGIKKMLTIPDIIIFCGNLPTSIITQECLKFGIPTISIVNLNNNINSVMYPIPANNNSKYSLNYIIKYLNNRILLEQQIKK